jgi:hypothetical protein
MNCGGNRKWTYKYKAIIFMMWLCIGLTLEEVPPDTEEEWVTCDLLLYGGSTTIYGNCFRVETWRKILEVYGENYFTHIFIDGGLHGILDNKSEIVSILHCLATRGIIKYGTHSLLRAGVDNVEKYDDPLGRNIFAPFTFIPIEKYTMENMEVAAATLSGETRTLDSIRVQYELLQSL